MKVVSVVGARPQFVKAFPVSDALAPDHDEVLVHTGQHYDEALSDVFFEELDIPEPSHHLGVGSGGHAVQTAEMMTGIADVVDREQPDVVLVYGDTNSTLAGALVGAKASTTVAHVEAGLRSGNWSMPEEVNRVLTDHCSDVCFAPTERAAETLAAEGISEGVSVTGDVMYDALQAVQARGLSSVDAPVPGEEYVLATVHRPRNTDDPERLADLVGALAEDPRPVVFPIHPRTRDALERYDLWEVTTSRLRVVDPVGYLAFLALVDGASVVATDSGGVQKEAMFLETPCITFREETEWPETVEAGWNVLTGADPSCVGFALENHEAPSPTGEATPYGDGTAAEQVVDALAAHQQGDAAGVTRVS